MIGTGLKHARRQSANFGERKAGIDMLVLHYTGMETGAAAIDWLCDEQSGVSCHYLVDLDGSIIQMVCESKRAWHAGKSYWGGVTDINSCSIGIEIQNQGHMAGLPEYPDIQIDAVIALSKDIITRHGIPASRVLGHSDVAPGRKNDPGEKFPWVRLAHEGIGLKLAGETENCPYHVREVQELLAAMGYGIEITGQFDARTRVVLEAFQQHFRQHKTDGKADGETVSILRQICAA